MKKGLFIFLSSILISQNAFAESRSNIYTMNESKTQIIYLKNGSSIVGDIVQKNSKTVKVRFFNNKEITLDLEEIDYISDVSDSQIKDSDSININQEEKSQEIKDLELERKKLEKLKKEMSKIIKLEDDISTNKKKVENLKTVRKEDWFQNPNYTRMFFAPTAKPLKKGEGYLQNINIFGFAGNYGITDNFSVGGIASLIPSVKAEQQVLAFTPKFGFNINKDLSVGGGLLYLSGAGVAQVGVGYGVVTLGSSDTNLTLGVGGAYGNISKKGFFANVGQESMVSNSGAIVGMAGGMHRIGENWSIVSENWIVNNNVSKDSSYLFSYGVRIFGEKSSWDIAVIYPVIPNVNSYPLPYVDYVWHF
ncbi:MAG: hypothetical protein U0354_15950 [Candidatus Sericytochromatia bacterium]